LLLLGKKPEKELEQVTLDIKKYLMMRKKKKKEANE
jgi:hypothetical protein